MRILLLTHSFNSLAQRIYVECKKRRHEVSVEIDVNAEQTREAVALYEPDVIVAPFLKRAIEAEIYSQTRCLIIHPGPPGDRGPSSLDWALLDGVDRWGVSIMEAAAVMDSGDVWAHRGFAMREASKSSLYRNEVTEAAVAALFEALDKETGAPQTDPKTRPVVKQSERAVDWSRDPTELVLRKIRSADGFPGVRDRLLGRDLSLFDAHPEPVLRGSAGQLLAKSNGAICRATIDGAVWIGHLRDWESDAPIKLPAVDVLGELVADLEEVADRFRDIWSTQEGDVGYLHFPFYNGAMSSSQCVRLQQAFQSLSTRLVVLMGGPDFWSNGINLNTIEAAASPADESWRNINAMDDLAETIIRADDRYVVAALRGNAGAGGVFLALAADRVFARSGVVLNPHYKGMGNLYGSEFWTYLLPRRASPQQAREITEARLPMSADEGRALGLIDDCFGETQEMFVEQLQQRLADLDLDRLIAQKRSRRAADEAEKPLSQYRQEELAQMALNFYGFDPSYHVARYHFVHRVAKSRTPFHLASHRQGHGGQAR